MIGNTHGVVNSEPAIAELKGITTPTPANEWREKFIQEYCVKRPAQPIRWIRSIFFDDTEQIETILEYFDKIKDSAIKEHTAHLVEKIEKEKLWWYEKHTEYLEALAEKSLGQMRKISQEIKERVVKDNK